MRKYLLIISLLLCTYIQAEDTLLLSISGVLDGKVVEEVQELLKESAEKTKLLIYINSRYGSIEQALQLTKLLYRWKMDNKSTIHVYLGESVVGPAAMLPYIADVLACDWGVSWGDILYQQEGEFPENILLSQIENLIPEDAKESQRLQQLAKGMVSPGLALKKEKDEWEIVKEKDASRLILNQKQLKSFNLLSYVGTWSNYQSRYIVDMSIQQPVKAIKPEEIFQNSLKEYIKFSPNAKTSIGYIYIGPQNKAIDKSTWIYVKSALKYYKQIRPSFLLLEINSPGGEVHAAEQISKALKEIDSEGIPVLAYINNWAISAGALLAYSCRYIVITPGAAMGAAEPVFASNGEMKSAPEKINSVIRNEFANTARYFNRNPLIAEAMVDKDIILVLRHNRITQLTSPDEIRTSGLDKDIIISAEGKLLTLNSEQMLSYRIANAEVAESKLEVEGPVPASASPVFSLPYLNTIPNAELLPYEMSWQEGVFIFLASPMVQSLLFLGLMIGFYIEISSPGFGLAGGIAVLCLLLIGVSSYHEQASSVLEWVFLLIGFILLMIELFVIPGFGILGFFGLLLMLGGLFALMLPAVDSFDFLWDANAWSSSGEIFLTHLAWLAGTFVVGVIILILLARYVLPKISLWSPLVSWGEQEGYTAVSERETVSIGEQGIAFSSLRPAGKAEINGHIYDVLTRGSFVEKGEKIQVFQVKGNRIFVEKVEE